MGTIDQVNLQKAKWGRSKTSSLLMGFTHYLAHSMPSEVGGKNPILFRPRSVDNYNIGRHFSVQ